MHKASRIILNSKKYLKRPVSLINMKRNIMLIIMFFVIVSSVSAIKVEKSSCDNDGSFEITLKANTNEYAETDDITITADGTKIKGSWDKSVIKMGADANEKQSIFKAEENQLVEEKDYTIKISYTGITESFESEKELDLELECPGLVFSCNRIGLEIEECFTTKSGRFTANLNIHGLEQSKEADLDPFDVIDYDLETQMLYKDINGYTSKKGNLIEGSNIMKIQDNTYAIKGSFPKYTTNYVKKMIVRFNDNLPRACIPTDYPDLILSDVKQCEYRQFEEEEEEEETGIPEGFFEKPEPEEIVEEEIPEEFAEEPPEEELNEKLEQELDEGNTQDEPVEETSESLNTGYIVAEDSSGTAKKKARLKVLVFSLLGVMIVSGALLSYLYKEGYFY